MDRHDKPSQGDVPSSGFAEDSQGADFARTDDPSLADDFRTLVADGRTYLEAEFAYQTSRAGFAAGRAKSSLVYGTAALAFAHLALIALVIGLLVSLATLVGPWIATAIVVGVLLAGAAIFAIKLRGKIAEVHSVFGSDQQ